MKLEDKYSLVVLRFYFCLKKRQHKKAYLLARKIIQLGTCLLVAGGLKPELRKDTQEFIDLLKSYFPANKDITKIGNLTKVDPKFEAVSFDKLLGLTKLKPEYTPGNKPSRVIKQKFFTSKEKW